MDYRVNSPLRSVVTKRAGTTLLLVFTCVGFTWWLLNILVPPVQSDGFAQVSPDGTYHYAVEREEGKPAEIHVVYNMDDPTAVEEYRRANDERSSKLLQSATGESLWTTITFAKPLPMAEMQTLLQNAGVAPVSYTQVALTSTGQRMGSTYFADSPEGPVDLEDAAKDAQSTDPLAPNYGAQYAGFMLVDGYVTLSIESLGRLIDDPRIFMVDTTAYDVQKLVGEENAVVRLSTPFWSMDWGELPH